MSLSFSKPDGLYDSQTPHKPQYHCRGRFKTDKDGKYDTICLRPTPYPIPFDRESIPLHLSPVQVS